MQSSYFSSTGCICCMRCIRMYTEEPAALLRRLVGWSVRTRSESDSAWLELVLWAHCSALMLMGVNHRGGTRGMSPPRIWSEWETLMQIVPLPEFVMFQNLKHKLLAHSAVKCTLLVRWPEEHLACKQPASVMHRGTGETRNNSSTEGQLKKLWN